MKFADKSERSTEFNLVAMGYLKNQKHLASSNLLHNTEKICAHIAFFSHLNVLILFSFNFEKS